jgi:hypothetical protein
MARKFSVAEAAWLLRVSEKWVRTRMGEIVPMRSERRCGKQGPSIFFTVPDIAALAIARRLEANGLPMSLARNVGQFVSDLTVDELNAAADGDKSIVATAGGSVAARLCDPADVIQKSEQGGPVDVVLRVTARSLMQGIAASLAQFDRVQSQQLVGASA